MNDEPTTDKTNWGGSTAFVTADTGYLLDIEGVVGTQQTMDSPYRDNRWAKPSQRHLRHLMRKVFEDWHVERAHADAVMAASSHRHQRHENNNDNDNDDDDHDSNGDSSGAGLGFNRLNVARPYEPFGFQSPGVSLFA